MFFKDIIGQEETKDRLRHLVIKDRLPHAMILLAKEGQGGLPLALALMSYILCKDRSSSDSCGQCQACNKTHKYIHPDAHFAYPVIKFGSMERQNVTSDQWLPVWRKALDETPFMNVGAWSDAMDAGDKLPNINVKECNEIRTKLGMMTYESDKKVMIIWLPEYLGSEGNRLLKLIEEPTDDTYIILVAENQDQILKTILSRCQMIVTKPFTPDDIKSYISTHYEVVGSQAEQIANLAQGNLMLAIDMCKGEEVEFSETLIEWLRTAYTLDAAKTNEFVQRLSVMSKSDLRNFMKYTLHFLQQYIYWMATQRDVPLTAKEMEVAKKLTAILNTDKADRISKLINDAIANLQRNANLKILLFADSLTIGKILREKHL
jgi:DNA polymerase III subunit delta'